MTDLTPLQELPNLEELTLDNLQVSGLAFLKELPNLNLVLLGPQVSDLTPLQELPR